MDMTEAGQETTMITKEDQGILLQTVIRPFHSQLTLFNRYNDGAFVCSFFFSRVHFT